MSVPQKMNLPYPFPSYQPFLYFLKRVPKVKPRNDGDELDVELLKILELTWKQRLRNAILQSWARQANLEALDPFYSQGCQYKRLMKINLVNTKTLAIAV